MSEATIWPRLECGHYIGTYHVLGLSAEGYYYCKYCSTRRLAVGIGFEEA
jgi:hypothetical protein